MLPGLIHCQLHGFARRLQVQERLTVEIRNCIQETLRPLGVAVGAASAALVGYLCVQRSGLYSSEETFLDTLRRAAWQAGRAVPPQPLREVSISMPMLEAKPSETSLVRNAWA